MVILSSYMAGMVSVACHCRGFNQRYNHAPYIGGMTKETKISPLSGASYILEKLPETDIYRLEQLLILAQGYSLAWDGINMFDYQVTKSKNGYRIPKFWSYIDGKKGFYPVIRDFDNSCLGEDRKATLDTVLDAHSLQDVDELKGVLSRLEGIKSGTVGYAAFGKAFADLIAKDANTSLENAQEVLTENMEDVTNLLTNLGEAVGQGGALGRIAILRALWHQIPLMQDELVDEIEPKDWAGVCLAMGYNRPSNARRRFTPEARERNNQKKREERELMRQIKREYLEAQNV